VFRFLFSKTFLVNILIAFAVIALLFWFTVKWIGSYTKHGESISVPDLRGMKITELEEFLSGKNLRFKISDSSVFDINKSGGIIIEQDPQPDSKVKENRTIYLTLTKSVPPKIKMPDLIDVSFRQAEAILQSYGLKTGQLIYKPDLAKNAVLDQQINGKSIKPGEELAKGTVIDLVLGDGMGNTVVNLPRLYNLTLSEALFVLKGSSLVPGQLFFDHTVKDSSEAKVYKQYPSYNDSLTMNQGEPVDLYLTQSASVLKENNPDND
jgi:beta-lactam-binding protein with PASTA domain